LSEEMGYIVRNICAKQLRSSIHTLSVIRHMCM